MLPPLLHGHVSLSSREKHRTLSPWRQHIIKVAVYIMTVTMHVIKSACSLRKSFSSDIEDALDPIGIYCSKLDVITESRKLFQRIIRARIENNVFKYTRKILRD